MTLSFCSTCRGWIDGLYRHHVSNRAERVRLTVFLFNVFMIITIMPLHLFGLLGMPLIHLQAITVTFILLAVVSLLLLAFGSLSLLSATNLLFIGGQVIQTFRIVLLTLHPEWGTHDIMTGNFFISYIVLLNLIMSFVPGTPVLVTVISVVTLAFARFYPAQGQSLCSNQVWFLFTVVEVFSCFLSIGSYRALTRLIQDRDDYKTTQDELLTAFGMDKQELVAFLQLWKGDADSNRTGWKRFLRHMNTDAQSRIVKAARLLEADKKTEMDQVSARFPMLTATELRVACLVIDGKTKREIADLLGKTENNIGSVRINIRRKLGLNASEDLREVLRGK
ncbi:MAG: hypothetical protein SPE56_01780 [Prevotella sp.]|nr:hypothetical protein [Prevotella sp.]